MSESNSPPVVPKKYLLPFILVTTLFALWGFANDITNPLVAIFKDVFVIDNAQSSWVQMAFYGGYATMAIPAALFIRKFSYKAGILIGLALYATGALLSIPAASGANFNLFIVALYVLTFGLAFLETTANPYILSMGAPETATRRLNLAQAFNPMGSLTGMFIAVTVILSTIQVEDFKTDVSAAFSKNNSSTSKKEEHYILPILRAKPREVVNDPKVAEYVAEVKSQQESAKVIFQEANEKLVKLNTSGYSIMKGFTSEMKILEAAAGADGDVTNALVDYKNGVITGFQTMSHSEMQKKDLKVVSLPYMIIGFVIVGMFILFLIVKMPNTSTADNDDQDLNFGDTLGRLLKNPAYVGGVIAQTFYVAAQIMVWTFIIQYAEKELGIDKATAQNHNILAMVIFLFSRFICTFFLKYISPGKLLLLLAIGGTACTLGAIHLQGMPGLYSLMAISFCMALMFPTIYGIALDGTGEDAKLGSAGLIFAIVGGAIMPRIQAGIMDMDGFMGTTATRGSFYLPALCFVIIAIFGAFAHSNSKRLASK